MTKREKIEKLLYLNNPFEGSVDAIVQGLRSDFSKVEGCTEEHMRAIDTALETFGGELRRLREKREQDLVSIHHELLTEEQIDAMLILASGDPDRAREFADQVVAANDAWKNAALAASPELMDLMHAAGCNFAANNTEGEVAQSLQDLSAPEPTSAT